MEIERKWMVQDWPALPPIREYEMEQGYISTSPTVRVRRESVVNGATAYVLCFKSPGTLVRKELETEIDSTLFAQLQDFVGLPFILKHQRRYALPGGLTLEVNQVDPTLPSGLFYAEIEFPNEEAARAFSPTHCGLGDYLQAEVTEIQGSSMGAYWERTRLAGAD